MLPFSVEVKGVTEEGKAKWVLAVDPTGDRLLVVHEDRSLHWHPMAACTFYATVPPDAPRPVMIVEPQGQRQGPGPAIVVPNRQTRRHPFPNGS